ncbi:MAG: single-stranded-DNA-specific exonuclease RecJ [Microcystaceae cyanobacterium]
MTQTQWHLKPQFNLPNHFQETVYQIALQVTKNQGKDLPNDGSYLAQLLWQRGIKNDTEVAPFLNADIYQPTPVSEFGQEIKRATKRLIKAYQNKDKVTIWGDFDADGVTSTSVLWEGLGQFFTPYLQLDYYIPNRFTESHGLNNKGLEQLAKSGTQLIVTCDTGSTNLEEIDYANSLGIDLIITDHHTLPEDRPPVVSIINPRYFADHHPLYHLSGVAVAYKLVEGLYDKLPTIPEQPIETLLDLVAIGLIADLVALQGDCRYLAQKGLEQLKKQTQNPTRIGVGELLKLCHKSGDRVTDISFGIGPRINAVSRIHGDASFGVELLTSKDSKRCETLALETELANSRRKGLQKKVTEDVKRKLGELDLSTTFVIVLVNEQWQSGVLGLVAGQIAQEYGRPTILLTTSDLETKDNNTVKYARGSARSVNQIDLYELVFSQSHLLHRFGGHPFAAGLSLPIENLPLFQEGINQQLRIKLGQLDQLQVTIEADLKVTVAELGYSLFRELNLLEPCGMGNPVPKLLIENCWFTDVFNKNIEDFKSKKIQYLRTSFLLWDQTVKEGFPGVWWGHSRDELPVNQTCDVIVELDFNTYKKARYEVRIIDVRSHQVNSASSPAATVDVIDYRNQEITDIDDQSLYYLEDCPIDWYELRKAYQQAMLSEQSLALVYQPFNLSTQEIWQKLIGIAKYLSRTETPILLDTLKQELGLSDQTLKIALDCLSALGFNLEIKQSSLSVNYTKKLKPTIHQLRKQLQERLAEEQFQRNYFYSLSLAEIRSML